MYLLCHKVYFNGGYNVQFIFIRCLFNDVFEGTKSRLTSLHDEVQYNIHFDLNDEHLMRFEHFKQNTEYCNGLHLIRVQVINL